MKKLLILLLCAPLWAQNTKSGSITGTTCFGIDTTNAGTVGISVQNSSTGPAWTGTIQASASIGGDPPSNINVTTSTGTSVSTITSSGTYYAGISGNTFVQVCGNTVTNTAAIKMFPAQYSKNIGGSGSLPAGLSFSPPTLTVSTAGSGNGTLALSGNTSGTATFTAPAVAGTNTNGVTMSNVLLGPTGSSTAPTYSWSGDPQSGLYSNGSGGPSIAASGTALILFSTAIININDVSTPFGWGAFGTPDTGISRTAAAVLSFGNGAQANETALIRDANPCRVTADITLPVNTATTVCTWSLPAVAKAWGWQCQLPWAITAGTGTNTLAIIANPSQTPTAATNGSAEIKTTNTNTATEATTAISASGGTTLLTSGTITPNAATFMSSTSGTLLASATAGTFSIQMTAAGTTATAAAKAGSTCWFY